MAKLQQRAWQNKEGGIKRATDGGGSVGMMERVFLASHDDRGQGTKHEANAWLMVMMK